MEFYDYKTLPVSGNQVVDSTKTGMTFYDQFLTTKEQDYLNNVKNLQGEIVQMSPKEYYDACAKYGFPNSPVSVENLKRTRRAQTKILDHLKDVLLVYKKRFPMPMLNIAQKGQEGLHRMMVIGDLFGWDHKVPVLVITHFDEERAQREEQERYKYDIDRNIERAIELACRYTYYSLEELEQQLTHEVATRFEFRDDVEVPSHIQLNETSEGYTFTFSGFEYCINKDDITMESQDELDDVTTEDQVDFLIRYFGDDWEKEFPELRTKFDLSEAHTDDTRNNVVKQAAKKARDYIVSKYGTETDLCGRCIEASDYLVDLLTDENIPAKAVEGYIIYDNDENCSDRAWDEHTWVELSDGTVVDVTVEQFNLMMDVDYPPILIQKNPHGYVYDKPDFLWLDESLTTRTSRRDNPDDFSPFRYLNEGLTIDGITTPDELMDWMNDNITYELVDDEYSNSNGVPTKTAEEVLETKTGHCAEQSYLEKEVLDELGYESFLVMVKENSSRKEYGAEGSAHVFLVYKDEKDNYCWFEHSMQHARGIHKYTSLNALLQDVANQWWRYDKNSDILEVRFIDKYITGVDNWGLAKECYKYPVKYTFDISDNILESDVPLEESYYNSGSINQTDIDAMNKAIVNEFGRDYPGEGCILIAPDGTFINVYPILNDHEDLCTWLTEQGFDGVMDEAEWLVETFNYVRCRNNPESLCYIELPLHTITRQQLYRLEDWITEKVKHDHISIELPDGIWKRFSLEEYLPEDIIKKIKRYYASGKLYEKLK